MKKMKPEEIRENIRRGDYELIAELSGYRKCTVEAQIRGERTLKQPVIDAAIKVIKSRSSLLNKVQK